MLTFSIFKEDEFVTFKQVIKKYSESMHYHDMNLTEDELIQLSWYMGSSSITPEARGQDNIDKLHFEIKRSLARRYSFELLLRGDKKAYQEFVQAQDNKISLTSFKALSEEANALDESIKVVIKASCFLAISDKAKEVLNETGNGLSNDSEEFLSQLAKLVQKNNLNFPLIKNLKRDEVDLLTKMYWPDTHFRHMLYTEGGNNMSRKLSEGVLKGDFNKNDFLAWKWRWLTNMFGFQGGPAAKYYDSHTHVLAATLFAELEKILIDPTYSYLEHYLLKRAELAGLHDKSLHLSKLEQQLLGHIAAYCHQINVVTFDLGKILYDAYIDFKNEFNDEGKLATLYEAQRNNQLAVTPTYVPAVINNAYLIFRNKFHMNEEESLKNASQFMCQVLRELLPLSQTKRISCMSFAKEANLQSLLEKWISNHHTLDFKLNENNEFIATEGSGLRNDVICIRK